MTLDGGLGSGVVLLPLPVAVVLTVVPLVISVVGGCLTAARGRGGNGIGKWFSRVRCGRLGMYGRSCSEEAPADRLNELYSSSSVVDCEKKNIRKTSNVCVM